MLDRLEQKDRDELLSAVSDGRLEPLGGMWTASELAEPGGESLLRQLQYGQRWMTSALGRTAGTAWFIDQFGQIPQLPQILNGTGFTAYVFGRDLPTDRSTLDFPADFWYVGPDGSRIQAHWMPGHYGPTDDNALRRRLAAVRQHSRAPLWMFPWGGDVVRPEEPAEEIRSRVAEAANALGLRDIEVDVATPEQYLRQVVESAGELPEIDWDFNPPLRIHDLRGTYENRILLEILNRRCEEALIALEALASQASIPLGTEHDASWKHVLFTQFHDTIGGSCSDDVYERAMARLGRVLSLTEGRTFELLSGCGDARPDEAVIFNPDAYERSETISLLPPDPVGDWVVTSSDGRVLASAQDGPAEPVRCRVKLEPLSAVVARFVPGSPVAPKTAHPVGGEQVLRTERYEITLDPGTGELTGLALAGGQRCCGAKSAAGPAARCVFGRSATPTSKATST